MFKVLLMLVISLLVSLSISKYYLNFVNRLFLDRVQGQIFKTEKRYVVFEKEKGRIFCKDSPSCQDTVLTMCSVYTPSKAVYRMNNGYVGLVFIEGSLYMTKIVKMLFNIDFSELTLAGKVQRHIFS